MSESNAVYLGDGVYLDTKTDPYHAMIYTFNGFAKQVIYLDPEVKAALIKALTKDN